MYDIIKYYKDVFWIDLNDKGVIMDAKSVSVSVVMGVRYRREDTMLLKRAIDSILSQNLDDFEFIICERESTSDAKKLLSDYAESDKRVILIDGNECNSFAEQLNKCLSVANGRFIARMDDDDYSFPMRFQAQVEFLESHHEYAFVGCQCLLECDGKVVGKTSFPKEPESKDFLFSQPYIHPALMFLREAIDAAGGYSLLPRCVRCEDYDLLLRLYELGFKGINLQEPYFQYTFPHNFITSRSLRDRLNETKTRFVRFKALGLMPKAFIYAIKPLIVALIPPKMLAKLKSRRFYK